MLKQQVFKRILELEGVIFDSSYISAGGTVTKKRFVICHPKCG